MNRKALQVVLFVSCFIILFSNARTWATGTISIGANTWYHDWKPPWKEGKTYTTPFLFTQVLPAASYMDFYSIYFPLNEFKFKMEKNFMAGPIVSFKFGNVSLSSVAMFGSYCARSSGFIRKIPKGVMSRIGMIGVYIDSSYTRKIFKYDVDSTLNYSINDFVKIFVGFKYQGYNYDEYLYYLTNAQGIYDAKGSSWFTNMGPAIGASFTIGIYKDLYLLYSISGSFLFGSSKYDFDHQTVFNTGFDPFAIIVGSFKLEKLKSVAGNTSLSLAYYFAKSNITLTIGLRYQLIYYFWQRTNRQSFLDYENKYEHFYGASVAVVYSFKVGRKK